MGKKKKRNSDCHQNVGSSISKTTELAPILPYLTLRLSQTPSSSSSRRARAIVKLTGQDAQSLDTMDNDEVWILAYDGDGGGGTVVRSVALCSVRIASMDGPRSPMLSSPRNKSSLPPGRCQIHPKYLSDRLMGVSDTTVDEDDDSSFASNYSVQTPRTPRQGFSFARGGGGDSYISPSSRSGGRSTKTIARSCSAWIVPSLGDLGTVLCNRLIRTAQLLELSSSTELPTTTGNSQSILQRLVLANFEGQCICPADRLTMSFRGKTAELTVVNTEGTPESLEDLSQAMSNLTLSANDVAEEHSIHRAVLAASQQRNLALYRITKQTRIRFLTDTVEEKFEQKDTVAILPTKYVAGLDQTYAEAKRLLYPPLLWPESFGTIKPPKGALLHGQSGVGKTALAKQLCEELRHGHNVNAEYVHCSSIQSKVFVVGEAEKMLSALFQRRPRNGAGTFIVLDDIDLICPKREPSRSEGPVDRLCATLLALLDGVQHDGKTVVLAITRTPSLLDPALRRPGRLDAEVEIPIPNEAERAAIFAFLLDEIGTGGGINTYSDVMESVMVLSRMARGFNGADCRVAVKEATRLAWRSSDEINSTPSLSLANLKEAIKATKPSSISSVTVEIPQVHWSSIGGMESVKQQLREAIEMPITHSGLFESLRIPPPRGVLLYGPPGCSKTLMARALATEGQMNFLAVKGPELLSKWLGESERALAAIFRRARLASPCIIFFDEVDAIASKRGGGEGAGGERLLSQLLTELDGVGTSAAILSQPRVVVVGATNRPDLLDNALVRPGRIDRMIYVGLPDASSRQQIFQIGLQEKPCDSNIDTSILASKEVSGGFSGAEIVAICREAALLAIEAHDETPGQKLSLSMDHLIRAANDMQRQVTPEMLSFYDHYKKTRAAQSSQNSQRMDSDV